MPWSRLSRHSSVVIVSVTVVSSGWFAARALAHVGEGAVFDDRRPAGEPRPVRAATLAPAPAAPARDASLLVTRNMFCSTCPPPGEVGGPAAPGVSHAVPRLIATHVGEDAWVTIDDPASGVAGLFRLGRTLPGGGVIEDIERGAMTVRFPDDTTQRVALASSGPASKPEGAVTGVAPAKGAWDDRVRAIGDNRWEVDRTMIRELVQAGTGTGGAVKGVRIQPVSKDGKLAGVRVAQARKGSLADALGLMPGDVIETVDGKPVDSIERMMELYGRLDQTRRVDLGIKRKGAAQTLIYDLP